MSVGEQHNFYLNELYIHLKGKNDLRIFNIDKYSHDYFSTLENGNEANKQYEFVRTGGSMLLSSARNSIQKFTIIKVVETFNFCLI
ncbi:hypothetical protein [uncultured Chryseobacterium sp.]|uniref:hypothetical protein n=1 Tax=uncultured Chryseobacterium sp. TaxID=259322 RepID=UPI0025EE1DDC|nr:hypothetical protein [uncultured Chryseobacterium sp.]